MRLCKLCRLRLFAIQEEFIMTIINQASRDSIFTLLARTVKTLSTEGATLATYKLRAEILKKVLQPQGTLYTQHTRKSNAALEYDCFANIVTLV